MKNTFIENWESKIKKGLLDYLVLSTFKGQPLYGHQLINVFKENCAYLRLEGTLYTKLKKMKAEGLLLSEWRNQENDLGTPVKYYH
jgi:DNA-binding PadR family transcriptional regulator